MGITDSICPEEGQFATILYRLQKVERRDSQERLPNPANDQVFGLSSRSAHLLGVRRQLWVLSNRN